MDLEKAIKQIGDLQAEKANLLSHKERLEADLKEARDRRRAAEEQAQKLVPEGSIVLSAEDAKLLDTYKQFGKPADLKAALDSKSAAEKQLAALQRQATIQEAAGTTFNAKALAKFLPDTAQLAQVEEKQDGKPVKVYQVVQPAAEEGKEPTKTALSEWVKNVESDLGISLHVEQQKKAAPTGHGSTPPAGPQSAEEIRAAKAATGMYDTL